MLLPFSLKGVPLVFLAGKVHQQQVPQFQFIWEYLILPLLLKGGFIRFKILEGVLFFSILSILFHYLLDFIVLDEKSAIHCVDIPLYVISPFFLLLSILSLCFGLHQFIYDGLEVGFVRLSYLYLGFVAFLNKYFHQIWGIFGHYLFKFFSALFLFPFLGGLLHIY